MAWKISPTRLASLQVFTSMEHLPTVTTTGPEFDERMARGCQVGSLNTGLACEEILSSRVSTPSLYTQSTSPSWSSTARMNVTGVLV
jgi:hypothetical protein